MSSDADGCWKEAKEQYYPLFVDFFLPEARGEIDWTRDYETLDAELHQLAPAGATGVRRVDKLVKVYRKGTGEPAFIHSEVQNRKEEDFADRMRRYNDRAQDKLNHPVVSLGVLGDDDPAWNPDAYEFEMWGFRKSVRFVLVKLLRYEGREEELLAEANPFGRLVVAHLLAMRTRQDPMRRAEGKLRLILGLHEKGMEADDIRQWYRLLDWMLGLPRDLDRQVWQHVVLFEKERDVSYISFAERYGMEQGLEKGLLQGIEVALELKFQAEGLALFSAIQQQKDVDLLQRILATVRTATTLDDVRRLLPPANGQAPSASDAGQGSS